MQSHASNLLLHCFNLIVRQIWGLVFEITLQPACPCSGPGPCLARIQIQILVVASQRHKSERACRSVMPP